MSEEMDEEFAEIGRDAISHLHQMYNDKFNMLGPSCRRSLRNFIDNRINFLMGQAHASRTGWVEIGDIPEEWKDPDGPNEGYLDIANEQGCRFPDATLVKGYETQNGRYTGGVYLYWQSASGHEIADPTHARLPPPPPSPKVIT